MNFEDPTIRRVVIDIDRAIEWRDWLASKPIRPYAKKIRGKLLLLPDHGITWPGAVVHIAGNLHELRIQAGAGYRVYFRYEKPLARIVWWGNKSDQDSDIERAQGET
jgi:putative addiction module killer protein